MGTFKLPSFSISWLSNFRANSSLLLRCLSHPSVCNGFSTTLVHATNMLFRVVQQSVVPSVMHKTNVNLHLWLFFFFLVAHASRWHPSYDWCRTCLEAKYAIFTRGAMKTSWFKWMVGSINRHNLKSGQLYKSLEDFQVPQLHYFLSFSSISHFSTFPVSRSWENRGNGKAVRELERGEVVCFLQFVFAWRRVSDRSVACGSWC